MDVFKSICDGECPFFDIKEACKVSRVRIFLLADLLGSQHLLEVLQRTSLTFKNSEKVVKRGCFKKNCDRECQFFFRKEGGI